MQRGEPISRPRAPARFRATKTVGLAFLFPATGLALYLAFLSATGSGSTGSFDLAHWIPALLLAMGASIGVLYIALLLRIGPPVVYSNGLDVRDHFVFAVITGRTFHPWEEFQEAEVQTITLYEQSWKRIVMKRYDGPDIAFDETDYGPQFLGVLISKLRGLPHVKFVSKV